MKIKSSFISSCNGLAINTVYLAHSKVSISHVTLAIGCRLYILVRKSNNLIESVQKINLDKNEKLRNSN